MDGPEIQCECQMCELEAAGYGPEAYAEIIMGHIGRVGWAVQGIPGDEQCPSWAYSIGLRHTYGVPELALFGLSLPNMAAIINEIGRLIADGTTVAAGDQIDGVSPCTFTIRPVHDSWRATSLFTTSDTIYGYLRPSYLQVFWPDRQGILPWEPGFEPGFDGLQPLLWSKWGRDWGRRATASTIAHHATTGIRAGDVLLLHDADHYGAHGNWRATAAALPQIADRIAAAGLQAASVCSGPAPGRLALTL